MGHGTRNDSVFLLCYYYFFFFIVEGDKNSPQNPTGSFIHYFAAIVLDSRKFSMNRDKESETHRQRN